MALVPEVVLDLYEGVPKDCFVSGVPFTLRGHEDNEIIPAFDTVPGPDGVAAKWIRFSEYLPFEDACRTYWMEASAHPLYVYVMPYTPLRDGYYLHELILDADHLPHDTSASEDLSVQPMVAQENAAGAPKFKKGIVEVAPEAWFTFSVVNYSLLWSKAQKYRILSYVSSPLDECSRRLDVCANLLRDIAPTVTTDELVSAADDAKRRLALVLMEKYADGILGVDPHDALLAMYPEIHSEVYRDQCRCHPELYPIEEDPPAAALSRIQSAMHQLGYEDQHIDDQLSIRQAEYDLMNAEGAVEFHNYNTNTHAKFLDSTNKIASAINPTRDYVREATTCHCLMGVLTQYEDGNPDEAN